jgi:hypothetical protein
MFFHLNFCQALTLRAVTSVLGTTVLISSASFAVTITEYSGGGKILDPVGITSTADGQIWFSVQTGSTGRMNTSGNHLVVSSPLPSSGNAPPGPSVNLTVDPKATNVETPKFGGAPGLGMERRELQFGAIGDE